MPATDGGVTFGVTMVESNLCLVLCYSGAGEAPWRTDGGTLSRDIVKAGSDVSIAGIRKKCASADKLLLQAAVNPEADPMDVVAALCEATDRVLNR